MPNTQNIFDSATIATILKWAVMILVTGFIAHFGKQLAEYIINKIRNARGRKAPGGREAHPAAPTHGESGAAERARFKLEKKLSKAAAKERKKKP